jgi:ABC-type phosphate transport system substrate-binding protein
MLAALVATSALLGEHASQAGVDELVVIVNANNPHARLSAGELRPIFLTTKRSWEFGPSIEPVNLPERTDQRRSFDKAVLGFDAEDAQKYWIDRRVRGDARPPRKVTSPSAVVAHVASSSGGIGYVPASAVERGVKVVARLVNGELRAP